jgi:hypothetical protein
VFNLSGFFGPDLPVNVMHLFVGLLYGYVDLLGGQGVFISVMEVVCLVIGSTSILAAKYLPGGTSGP